MDFDDLPPRQKELARLIHQGKKLGEAARVMNVSYNTARVYVTHIHSRLDTHTLLEVALVVERSINKRVTDWKEKGLV